MHSVNMSDTLKATHLLRRTVFFSRKKSLMASNEVLNLETLSCTSNTCNRLKKLNYSCRTLPHLSRSKPIFNEYIFQDFFSALTCLFMYPQKVHTIVCVCGLMIASYYMELGLKGLGLESCLQELVGRPFMAKP